MKGIVGEPHQTTLAAAYAERLDQDPAVLRWWYRCLRLRTPSTDWFPVDYLVQTAAGVELRQTTATREPHLAAAVATYGFPAVAVARAPDWVESPVAPGVPWLLPTRPLNRTETVYRERLRVLGHLRAHEAVNLRVGVGKCWYLPDFLAVVDGVPELHETKGVWEDDALVKIRAAGLLYPIRIVSARATGRRLDPFRGWAFGEPATPGQAGRRRENRLQPK